MAFSPCVEKRIYRRNLPHRFPPGFTIFLTWRLFGSIPNFASSRINYGRELSDREKFLRMEECLERRTDGPRWLANPRIGETVSSVLERGEAQFNRYKLHEYVVMPNHVHVLISPCAEVCEITRTLKGVSARLANEVLGMTGAPFWQDESYDHWCRDEEEFHRVRMYIARNPVRAKLVEKPEDWPWSGVSRRASMAQSRVSKDL